MAGAAVCIADQQVSHTRSLMSSFPVQILAMTSPAAQASSSTYSISEQQQAMVDEQRVQLPQPRPVQVVPLAKPPPPPPPPIPCSWGAPSAFMFDAHEHSRFGQSTAVVLSSLGGAQVASKARPLMPPPPPQPPPPSEAAASFSLSPLAEVPICSGSGIEIRAGHAQSANQSSPRAGHAQSGNQSSSQFTITSLKQLSPQVIDELLDMLASRLRSSCSVSGDAQDAPMGLASAGETIIDGSVADGLGPAGSGTCVASSSDSAQLSQVSAQQQYDLRHRASGGSWHADDGDWCSSGRGWQWRCGQGVFFGDLGIVLVPLHSGCLTF